ncbi:MAG: glycosyltransferase [Acidobacteriota bacterium]
MKKKIVHYRDKQVFKITENWLYYQFKNFSKYNHIYYSKEIINRNLFPEGKTKRVKSDFFLMDFILRIFRKIFKLNLILLFNLLIDNPILIHAHFGLDACLLIDQFKSISKIKPLFVSFYGFDAYLVPIDPFWKQRYQELFQRSTLCLAEGPVMAEKLKKLGCPKDKILIHKIGIEVEKYKFFQRNIEDKKIVKLIIAGRFVEKKGIIYALKLIKLLKKNRKKVSLTIVGDSDQFGTKTIEKKKISDYIKRNELEEDVVLTGFLSPEELLELSYLHHILLMPSVFAANGDAEGGHPVFLTEMALTGIPIIAFDHCDIKEIVVNNKTGILVDDKDINGLCAGVEKIITEKKFVERITKNARTLVEHDYNIQKQNKILENIYEKYS